MQDIVTFIIIAVCVVVALWIGFRRMVGRGGGCSDGCSGCSAKEECSKKKKE